MRLHIIAVYFSDIFYEYEIGLCKYQIFLAVSSVRRLCWSFDHIVFRGRSFLTIFFTGKVWSVGVFSCHSFNQITCSCGKLFDCSAAAAISLGPGCLCTTKLSVLGVLRFKNELRIICCPMWQRSVVAKIDQTNRREQDPCRPAGFSHIKAYIKYARCQRHCLIAPPLSVSLTLISWPLYTGVSTLHENRTTFCVPRFPGSRHGRTGWAL